MMTARAAHESAAVYGFGRYETLFRVGTGGMAEVYAARLAGEAGFERLVAIKRLLPHLAHDARHVARFLDEARLAARVVHRHVVQTLDLGRCDEGEPFLVLELVEGCSLDRLLGGQRGLPLPVLLTWLSQVAEGLHAAHVARAPDGTPLGIVHRDVSPHNILVGVDGDARIGDFGVAQAALKSASTPAGQVHGKLAYLSPEQAQGLPLDARSDVFSLGIVAWEAVTRRPLFHADHPAAIIRRVCELEIPPPHRLVRALPARVSDVIMAALARDRAARPQDAQDLARALAGACEALGRVPGARSRASHVRAAQDSVWRAGSVTRVSRVSESFAPKRSGRVQLRAALALLALLAGAGFTTKTTSTPSPPSPSMARAAPPVVQASATAIAPEVAPVAEVAPPVAPGRPRTKRRPARAAGLPHAAPASAPRDAARPVALWGGRS